MTCARFAVALAAWCAVVAVAGAASAHPAGLTSINRYIGVQCDAEGRLHVAYLIDFAELPAYSELDRIDANHDGTVSPDEQRAYLDSRLPPLVAGWTVEIDGVRASPRVTGSSLDVSEGERGLATLRVAADVVVDRPPGSAEASRALAREVTVAVRDPAFTDHTGWREIVAEASASAAVASGPAGRAEDALAYSPAREVPRVDDARFTFRLLPSGGPPTPPGTARRAAVDARVSTWARALKKASGSGAFSAFSALALGLAFALGAAHALSPGHGKALAAAYLVGRRARPREALLFGATVTLAHTAVVFVVGCLALTMERRLGSERVMKSLEVLSAVSVVGLGVVQFSRRLREVAGAAHAHVHDLPGSTRGGLRSLAVLAASAGIVPCPSALAVLLAAIALHRYVLGLVLVVAFSGGVAATLVGVGLLVVLARGLVERSRAAGQWLRWLPLVSSACVLVVGILLCAAAWS